jgi:diacylglycerol kinase (ATP)
LYALIIATAERAVLIYNPMAGKLRRNPQLLSECSAILQRQGIRIELAPTNGPNVATNLAARHAAAGADVIFAFGGDGTVNEVANGLVDWKTPLAVLPGGTANVLACELKLPLDPRKVAALFPQMKPRRIACGRAENAEGSRRFLCMAGAGVDAAVVRNVNPMLKRNLGKFAYWVAGFQSAFGRLPQMQVRLEDKVVKCSFALASRVRNYGGDLEIAPTIRLTDDDIEVVLFEGKLAPRFILYLMGVLLRQTKRLPGAHIERTQRAELTADEGIFLQLDGESAGSLPAQIFVDTDALTLMMPPQFDALKS